MDNRHINQENLPSDSDISLGEIIVFFSTNSKQLVLGGVLGALLGLSTWFFVGYKAELVINNNNAINFVSWRSLSKNLPNLASDLVERGNLSTSDEAFYKKLSDPKWWTKNVVPTYTISKSDAKELAGISKELQDTAGTSITNLIINYSSFDKQDALDNVEKINDFIRSACTYLTVKEMLNGYESEALALDAEIQQKIKTAEVELQYLSKKANNLEELRQRFPANVGANFQNIIDPKDAAAKYLPISTQLVAVNTDIYNTQESLSRLSDSLMRNLIIKQFVEQSLPLVHSGNKDGLLLVDQLIKVQENIRDTIHPNDIKNIKAVNEILATLISTKTRFSKFLESFLAPTAEKPNLLLPLISGFFAGVFFSLLFVIGMKSWGSYRINQNQQHDYFNS
jgi:hypothetical protein